MKKVFILCLSVLFIVLLSLYSSAASFTAYSSVTPSTSQIDNLINLMLNQSDFDYFSDWIGIRTDQYDYSIFYNIENGSAVRLRYYGIQNGYNMEYHYTKNIENNFSFDKGYYSIAGNVYNSLASNNYNLFLYNEIIKISVSFILVLFIFFVFRIRKRSRSLSL